MRTEISSDARGVDIVAFVMEVWRSKLVFCGIFVVVTACLMLGHVLLAKLAPDKVANDAPRQAYFMFNNRIELDPLDRNSSQLLGDFLEKLAAIDSLGLVGEHDFLTGDLPPERRFFIKPTSNYSGRIIMEVHGGSDADFQQIRAEFLEASRLQFEETKLRANSDLDILKNLSTNTYDKKSDFVAEKIFRTTRFLEDKDVVSGVYRYFQFSRLQFFSNEISEAKSHAGGTTKKSLGISLLFGLISASLFIAIRMEVNKGRLVT